MATTAGGEAAANASIPAEPPRREAAIQLFSAFVSALEDRQFSTIAALCAPSAALACPLGVSVALGDAGELEKAVASFVPDATACRWVTRRWIFDEVHAAIAAEFVLRVSVPAGTAETLHLTMKRYFPRIANLVRYGTESPKLSPASQPPLSASVVRWPTTGASAACRGVVLQLLGILVLDVGPASTADGSSSLLIQHGELRFDFVRSGMVASVYHPIPMEPWRPQCRVSDDAIPARRRDFEAIASALGRAWTSMQPAALSAVVDTDVVICPPWELRFGVSAWVTAVSSFFQDFDNVDVSPVRVLYDDNCSTFAVVEQNFSCTNKRTGARGTDRDIAVMELMDPIGATDVEVVSSQSEKDEAPSHSRRIRYWRNYFDSVESVQEGYFPKVLQSSPASCGGVMN